MADPNNNRRGVRYSFTTEVSSLCKTPSSTLVDFGVVIPTRASQLFDGTHHTIGTDSAKFSFFDFNATRCFLSVMSTGNTSAVKNNRNLISLFYIRRCV